MEEIYEYSRLQLDTFIPFLLTEESWSMHIPDTASPRAQDRPPMTSLLSPMDTGPASAYRVFPRAEDRSLLTQGLSRE